LDSTRVPISGGLLATQIAESTALRLFRHLLGDTSTATIYKSRAADILQTHYPKSSAMNQLHAHGEEEPKFNSTNSWWHQLLELHLTKEKLESTNQQLESTNQQLKARADEQRVLIERLQAELDQLKSSSQE
jgi:predicted RNase H-like nuclease (RuvC/YqgF family)